MSSPDINLDNTTLSIVMVTYHTGPILFRALEAAIVQQGLQELVIVDNGNPPATLVRLQRFAEDHPQVKLLTGHGNIGFARGCNLGFAHAHAEYVLFLNPDCILPNNGIQTAMHAMRASPRAWMAGARLTYPDGHLHRGNRRNLLTLRTLLSQGFGLWRFSKKKFPPLNQDDSSASLVPTEVPAISGAFMLLKHARFEWLGKFDEAYPLHVEDLDLCKRIADLGGKTMVMPALRVVHYRSSSRAPKPVVEWKKLRGIIHYFRKHYSGVLPVGVVPLVMAMLLVRFGLMSVAGGLMCLFGSVFRRPHRGYEEALLKILEAKNLPEFTLQLDANSEEPSSPLPILLLGVSTVVGTYLLRQLSANNLRTYALYHRETTEFSHRSITWVQGDLATGQWNLPFPEVVTDATRSICPDTVISVAPVWLLPMSLSRFAAMGVKRLVCFSTTSVESKAESGNAHEQQIVTRCLQSEEKLLEMCPKLGIDLTIIRPTMIYGAGLDRNVSVISRVIRRFGFFPVTPGAQGKRQPVHAEDLAALVMKILHQPTVAQRHIYYACGGSTLTYTEMVNAIGAALGRTRPSAKVVKHLPLWLSVAGMLLRKPWLNGEIARRMTQDLAFDDTPTRTELGWQPRAFLANGKADLGL